MYLIKDSFISLLAHKEQEFITEMGKDPKILILTVRYFDLMKVEFEKLYGSYKSDNKGDFFKGLPIHQTIKENIIEFY